MTEKFPLKGLFLLLILLHIFMLPNLLEPHEAKAEETLRCGECADAGKQRGGFFYRSVCECCFSCEGMLIRRASSITDRQPLTQLDCVHTVV